MPYDRYIPGPSRCKGAGGAVLKPRDQAFRNAFGTRPLVLMCVVASLALSGCVVRTAVKTTGKVAKTAVKTTGAVACTAVDVVVKDPNCKE